MTTLPDPGWVVPRIKMDFCLPLCVIFGLVYDSKHLMVFAWKAPNNSREHVVHLKEMGGGFVSENNGLVSPRPFCAITVRELRAMEDSMKRDELKSYCTAPIGLLRTLK